MHCVPHSMSCRVPAGVNQPPPMLIAGPQGFTKRKPLQSDDYDLSFEPTALRSRESSDISAPDASTAGSQSGGKIEMWRPEEPLILPIPASRGSSSGSTGQEVPTGVPPAEPETAVQEGNTASEDAVSEFLAQNEAQGQNATQIKMQQESEEPMLLVSAFQDPGQMAGKLGGLSMGLLSGCDLRKLGILLGVLAPGSYRLGIPEVSSHLFSRCQQAGMASFLSLVLHANTLTKPMF